MSNYIQDEWFVVYHEDSDLGAAFIARPVLNDRGDLVWWHDQAGRQREPLANDQVTRLTEYTDGRSSPDSPANFWPTENLFSV